MTERKPAGVSFESWVERQLREARERGSFDDLPGTGKPLQPASFDELAWVREKLRREDLPVSALLPPALAVAKEVEDLPARLARERSEARVRAIVADVNGRIDAARRGPQVGPPVHEVRGLRRGRRRLAGGGGGAVYPATADTRPRRGGAQPLEPSSAGTAYVGRCPIVSTGWDPSAPGVLGLPSGRLLRGRGLRRPVPAGPAPARSVAPRRAGARGDRLWRRARPDRYRARVHRCARRPSSQAGGRFRPGAL